MEKKRDRDQDALIKTCLFPPSSSGLFAISLQHRKQQNKTIRILKPNEKKKHDDEPLWKYPVCLKMSWISSNWKLLNQKLKKWGRDIRKWNK